MDLQERHVHSHPLASAAALPTMYGAFNAWRKERGEIGRSFIRSVGRSVDGGTPYFAISPPPSTPLLPLALAVSRSPVEIAMILSGGIIGIHLQDERGRSECTFSVAHRDASNTHALA